MSESPEGLTFNPGSFKDPEGRVFEYEGSIFRSMTTSAAERMLELQANETISKFVSQGLLIPSQIVSVDDSGDFPFINETIMKHERIPVITYPCEWSFDMMRDAALTTLRLLLLCVARGLTLKDATAYNVTFHKGRMVFFDTLSIENYVSGTPWEGYSQFCREFLFPLMLTSYQGVDFHPAMKASLKGIPVGDMFRLIKSGDKLRPAVFKHIVLQAYLDRSFAGTDKEMRTHFKGTNFSIRMIEANVKSLCKTVKSLRYTPKDSVWGDYEYKNSYGLDDNSIKSEFIKTAITRLKPRQLVDLGGNTGSYSLPFAPLVEQIICLDVDPAAINTLYGKIKDEEISNVVPVVGNLLEPTPAMGWNLAERGSFFDRIRGDGFLALALVHHICIGGNVPLAYFAEVLRRIAPTGVVEWVDGSDRMVKKLMRNRQDVFSSYTWENFRNEIENHFVISSLAETHNGSRRLCLLEALV